MSEWKRDVFLYFTYLIIGILMFGIGAFVATRTDGAIRKIASAVVILGALLFFAGLMTIVHWFSGVYKS